MPHFKLAGSWIEKIPLVSLFRAAVFYITARVQELRELLSVAVVEAAQWVLNFGQIQRTIVGLQIVPSLPGDKPIRRILFRLSSVSNN